MIAARKDSCPGCGPAVLDVSEAGIARVCGAGAGVCQASVERVTLCYPQPAAAASVSPPTPPDPLGIERLVDTSLTAARYAANVRLPAPPPPPCVMAPETG
jgi:hypothetical protein